MSTRETSPEIATMAGRILSAGNPLDNDQVVLTLLDGAARANTGKQAQAALRSVLQPYFDNMLSLAGSCLSQTEDDETPTKDSVSIETKVRWESITNAITGGLEGGASYWLRSCEYSRAPSESGKLQRPWYAETDFWTEGGKMKLSYDNPEDEEGHTATKEVGAEEIRNGLTSMADNDPLHFADLINENDDAITHDVFLQHVLRGEVVYG